MLTREEILRKEVVYKLNSMEMINISRNIECWICENKKTFIDLYSSKNSKGKSPVVVLVHGEAKDVNFKESGQYTSLAKLVASVGLRAVTFNHKVLSDGFTIEEVNSDINNILKYLIENADKLSIDKDRIGIWCFSGGAPFGLYAAMNNCSDYIRCAAVYYGLTDFKRIGELISTSINLKDSEIREYSPVNLIKSESYKIPPLFIARAGLDSSAINEPLDEFIMKALINNLTVDVYNHPTGNHAFDLFDDNDRSREIIAETLDFFKKHLEQV
ncbi:MULTISPECIES: dienelactone hydrolase family protein [Clostridium]|uniref:dienelactone hydrolase family protein n=1 Tax=Clostridium TaxID=1485 RepID=UPI0008259BB5|nr:MULTISPECIES: dienelactone hydrolase family protein [Clostridium]PJI06917.1 esterase [Clostridium sp. CT7]